ncbi:hypothetical protein R3P38DRAFT_2583700, partial [Favolaschia claudopus]
IRAFKCAYVEYQSLEPEDWRGARDILRCNPLFQKSPRYVNMTEPVLETDIAPC